MRSIKQIFLFSSVLASYIPFLLWLSPNRINLASVF